MSFCLWNQCGHLFDSPESLGQHLDMVHVQEQADMENPAFSCQWNQCKRVGIVITTRKNLLAHLRQHTGTISFIICSN